MPHNSRYSESELNFIRNNYASMSVQEIASSLNRTPKSVRAKIERLRIPLSSLSRNAARHWSESEIAFIRENYSQMSDAKMSKALGISVSMVCRKRMELGLLHHHLAPYEVGGYMYQYIDGEKVCLHRHVVEQSIGRPLADEERVHHIDGDKTNYRLDNLYLCSDRSVHMFVHSSLERVAFQLVRNGVIKFNSDTGEYYL